MAGVPVVAVNSAAEPVLTASPDLMVCVSCESAVASEPDSPQPAAGVAFVVVVVAAAGLVVAADSGSAPGL